MNLIEALSHLDSLLKHSPNPPENSSQTAEYRKELEKMLADYDRLLEDLSKQIAAYELTFSRVKGQHLVPQLKALKKELPTSDPAFELVIENLRMMG